MADCYQINYFVSSNSCHLKGIVHPKNDSSVVLCSPSESGEVVLKTFLEYIHRQLNANTERGGKLAGRWGRQWSSSEDVNTEILSRQNEHWMYELIIESMKCFPCLPERAPGPVHSETPFLSGWGLNSTFRCRAVIVVMFTTGGALRLPANVAVWITRCDSKLSVHHLVSTHVKDDICARTTLVITYASTFWPW